MNEPRPGLGQGQSQHITPATSPVSHGIHPQPGVHHPGIHPPAVQHVAQPHHGVVHGAGPAPALKRPAPVVEEPIELEADDVATPANITRHAHLQAANAQKPDRRRARPIISLSPQRAGAGIHGQRHQRLARTPSRYRSEIYLKRRRPVRRKNQGTGAGSQLVVLSAAKGGTQLSWGGAMTKGKLRPPQKRPIQTSASQKTGCIPA